MLDLYLHRGSFETVLADEDDEQDADRWYSHTPCGQEFAQIIAQWIWNLRLELGQALSPDALLTTEFAVIYANSWRVSIIKLGTNLPLIGLRSLSRRFFSKIVEIIIWRGILVHLFVPLTHHPEEI